MLIEKLKEISNIKTNPKITKKQKSSEFSSLLDASDKEKIEKLGITDVSALPFLSHIQTIMSRAEHDKNVDRDLVEKSKNILLSLNKLQLSMLSIEKDIFDKKQAEEKQRNIDALNLILDQMGSVKTENAKLTELISHIKTRAKVEIAKLESNIS